MEKLIFPVTKKEAERTGASYSSEANKNALFPSQLRELRKEKGVSQETVARDLGVSKSTIGLYETGDTLPDAKTLRDLATYFDVSSDWLLGLSSVKSKDKSISEICDYTGLSECAVTKLNHYSSSSSGKIMLYLFNELLNDDNIFTGNIHSFTLKYVVASVALKRNLQDDSHQKYLETILEISHSAFKKLLDGNAALEVSVADAKWLYRSAALHAIEQVFNTATEKAAQYVEEKKSFK